MKKIIFIGIAASLFTACGIYKPYTRPEVRTDDLYGAEYATADTASIADIGWRELFTDRLLQRLIDTALVHNTDLQVAQLRITEAEATLKAARLAYLPSFNFAPTGGTSSFDGAKAAWTYNVPVTASWEVDIFSRLTNAKRRSRAALLQSEAYCDAVQTQLIANVADYYYRLLSLDAQVAVTEQAVERYREQVHVMRALKAAGNANEAAVAQTEATLYAAETSLYDLRNSIRQTENSLTLLLGDTPHTIERSRLEVQSVPAELAVGVPLQLLARRPDIRQSEQALVQAYYATAEARAALYPSLTLSGSAGWTNSAGAIVANPGKLLLSAAGSLLQPIFNAGQNRARVKIAKAQQEEARLAFQQALLNAGAEVNNALTQVQTARAKTDTRREQLRSLERAVESTQLLMRHGSTTYLEVLTAQQALLSARLSAIADRLSELQGIVSLYHALGGENRLSNK